MIDVESLSFSYVSELTGDRVDALAGVDLSAPPGTHTERKTTRLNSTHSE